jgi:polar amino acid transport system ATP-binding protein
MEPTQPPRRARSRPIEAIEGQGFKNGGRLAEMIEIADLWKAFGANEVLKGVSLRVGRGSVVAIIGPSGSGKSTLLRCINLLEEPDCGRIRVADREMRFGELGKPEAAQRTDRALSAFRARTGMVFQHFNLFPHMTALGNVMAGPLIVRRMDRVAAAAIAGELLAKVGLSDKADAYPSHLSGGQRQRVAIARALALRPSVILLDEVTSALDPELVGEVLAVIAQLAHDGMTMLIVTHEIAFAHEVADQVLFMSDGAIVESGPPGQVLERPENPRTRAFLARFHRFVTGFSGAQE